MMSQARQPLLELIRLIRIVDRENKEVHEPGERVLIHRVDVGEIGDREEKDRRVDGDRRVAHPRLVDLLLRHLGNLLQGIVGKGEGFGEECGFG